jgi:hypothetical protein
MCQSGNRILKYNRYPDPESEREWRERLRVLRASPAPDLARGRARVLAKATPVRREFLRAPRRASLALAVGVSLAVFMLLAVVNSSFGRIDATAVAMTRTDTVRVHPSGPEAAPVAAATAIRADPYDGSAAGTPLPGIVPEPPRSPVNGATRPISPESLN